MTVSSSADSSMAMMNLQAQDMVQRKLEVDRLRTNLNGVQDKDAKLREACEGFESIFIQKIWEQMRKNVQQDGYLHSRDEQTYQGMYDQEFAKKMTAAGGIGLADMLYEQLSQRLGESSRTSTTRNNPRLPIVPSGSSPGGLGKELGPLHAEAAGIPLTKKEIRPLYEDVPVEQLEKEMPVEPETVTAFEQDMPAFAADPAPDMDFEALSQQLLLQEIQGEEEAAVSAPASNALAPEDEDVLATALLENMAEVRQGELAALLRSYPVAGNNDAEEG